MGVEQGKKPGKRMFAYIIFFSAAVTALFFSYSFYVGSNSIFANLKAYYYTGRYTITHKSVIHGKGNWLFYGPSLRSMVKVWPQGNIQRIIKLNNELSARDIKLLVVPVPDKEDIYPENLGSEFPVKESRQRIKFIHDLRTANVHVIDLFNTFKEAKKSSLVYFCDDTHWTDDGLDIAAKTIADTTLQLFTPAHKKQFVLIDTVVQREGDLSRLGGQPSIEIRKSKSVFEKTDSVITLLKDDPKSEIFLLGDSFLGMHYYVSGDVSSRIAYYTGTSKRAISSISAGKEGIGMIKSYLSKTKSPPKIVIWIFTSRALPREII